MGFIILALLVLVIVIAVNRSTKKPEAVVAPSSCAICGDPKNFYTCKRCGAQVCDAHKTFFNNEAYCDRCKDVVQSSGMAPMMERNVASTVAVTKPMAPLALTVPAPQPEEDVVRCPKCKSTQVAPFKKGFSLGKAVVGGILLGGVPGLFVGALGANKVEVVCLKCGKRWTAGKAR